MVGGHPLPVLQLFSPRLDLLLVGACRQNQGVYHILLTQWVRLPGHLDCDHGEGILPGMIEGLGCGS